MTRLSHSGTAGSVVPGRATIAAAFLAAGLGLSPAAQAEDVLLSAPEVTIAAETVSTGLYLRADLGVAAFRPDAGSDLSVGGTRSRFDDDRFDRPVSGTLGLGYRFTDILRADITADLFEGRFSGTSDATGTIARYRADLRGVGIMANGYVDLATVAGFTPYLGAGIGATSLDWNDVTAKSGGVPISGSDYAGDSSWRFTYALMAGASYDLTERLKLDISYRYSDIASGDMFARAGETARDDGLSRHEVRAGLRFQLY
ncbi:opacity protein-like surface antigen [Rhizobium sp. PP-F2F-G48]|uniref:outer membrane protein n=1 Tax=Rhizobium sp. PP-F2F-G48 TaxID=2135651 RepID=UPI00104C7B90|nr:outer membrane protein [Rhizobium sp. PP-F2F-G48]TCM53577.1 opacity protein-like surface antigen [Rhizobium sp. PP-F2F-G48]